MGSKTRSRKRVIVFVLIISMLAAGIGYFYLVKESNQEYLNSFYEKDYVSAKLNGAKKKVSSALKTPEAQIGCELGYQANEMRYALERAKRAFDMGDYYTVNEDSTLALIYATDILAYHSLLTGALFEFTEYREN